MEAGEIVATTANRPFAAARNDYAEAAAAALSQDGHAGATHELGGAPFTMSELAEAITDAAGTAVVYRDIPSDALRALLASRGVPDGYATFFAELEESTAAGAKDTHSGDLHRLLGRPPTPLRDAVRAAAREHGLARAKGGERSAV